MPALDLALRLRVIGHTARMLYVFLFQPLTKVARDIAGTVVTEQAWLMDDMHLITARCLQCEVQRIRHIFGSHVGAEFPRDDVTAVIVQDRAEIEPAPVDDLEI